MTNTRFTETDKTLTGLFKDKEDAENAYEVALRHGYTPQEISVVMSDESQKKYYNSDLVQMKSTNKSVAGLAIGGAVGGTVGGILAALAAMGTSLVIPGLGLIVAGPFAAALAGAGAGSVTGGCIGGLVGLGIPEERAALYDAGIKKGEILIAVHKNKACDSQLILNDWEQPAVAV